jgi:hypothetical protein
MVDEESTKGTLFSSRRGEMPLQRLRLPFTLIHSRGDLPHSNSDDPWREVYCTFWVFSSWLYFGGEVGPGYVISLLDEESR